MKTQVSDTQIPELWRMYLTFLRKNQESTFRLFIYGFGLCIGYLGLTDSHSLMYMAGQQRDGAVLIYMIITASIIGFIDMAANSGGKERLPAIKKRRHFILLSLAFCFLGQLFVAYNSIRSDGVLLFYTWPGLVTMFAAVNDARKRRRELCPPN